MPGNVESEQVSNERIFALMEINLNKLITLTEMTQKHNTELLQTVENQTALIERLTAALNQQVAPLAIAIDDKIVTIGEPWAITKVGEDKPFTAKLVIKDGDIKWQCNLGHNFYTDKVTPLFKRDSLHDDNEKKSVQIVITELEGGFSYVEITPHNKAYHFDSLTDLIEALPNLPEIAENIDG